jgi:penicillin-binding protein 2
VRNPIVQGLTGVVASPEGTAYWPFHTYAHFDLNAFPVAGKTGTASNAPGLEPNAWFVGFGPTNSPRYAILCVIGQGGYGASASAPVVAQAFDYLVHNPLPPVAKSINPSLAPLVPAKK